MPDVRFGSEADIATSLHDVRYSPESRHRLSAVEYPLSPKSRRERVFSFDYFLGELMAPCRIDSGIPSNGDAQGEYEGRCCADWYDCEMER